MIRYATILFLFFTFSFCEDNLAAQKQNVLYIQNMIEIEEKIAKNFEKYLLTEFSIPTMEDLKDDDYLGSNFSVSNRMGEDIDFKSSSDLQIKYAISNNYLKRSANSEEENYLVQLYNRDLYRDYTTAFYDSSNLENSFVEFKLKSQEAKTIFSILKNGNSIEKTCVASLKSTYCNNNDRTIRWYNSASKWIEYDKKDFENGNVTVFDLSVKNDEKLNNLKVGAYVFVQNSSRYIKLIDNKILKVD